MPNAAELRAQMPLFEANQFGQTRSATIATNVIESTNDVEPPLDLVNSIERLGLLQPVILQEVVHAEDPAGIGHYRIVAGRRRVACMRTLGRTVIPALVYRHSVPTHEIAAATLSENMIRGEDPAGEYQAIQRLIESGMTIQGMADILSLPRRELEARLTVGYLAPPLREALGAGHLSWSLARRIARMPITQQHELAAHYTANPPARGRVSYRFVQNWLRAAGLSLPTASGEQTEIEGILPFAEGDAGDSIRDGVTQMATAIALIVERPDDVVEALSQSERTALVAAMTDEHILSGFRHIIMEDTPEFLSRIGPEACAALVAHTMPTLEERLAIEDAQDMERGAAIIGVDRNPARPLPEVVAELNASEADARAWNAEANNAPTRPGARPTRPYPPAPNDDPTEADNATEGILATPPAYINLPIDYPAEGTRTDVGFTAFRIRFNSVAPVAADRFREFRAAVARLNRVWMEHHNTETDTAEQTDVDMVMDESWQTVIDHLTMAADAMPVAPSNEHDEFHVLIEGLLDRATRQNRADNAAEVRYVTVPTPAPTAANAGRVRQPRNADRQHIQIPSGRVRSHPTEDRVAARVQHVNTTREHRPDGTIVVRTPGARRGGRTNAGEIAAAQEMARLVREGRVRLPEGGSVIVDDHGGVAQIMDAAGVPVASDLLREQSEQIRANETPPIRRRRNL